MSAIGITGSQKPVHIDLGAVADASYRRSVRRENDWIRRNFGEAALRETLRHYRQPGINRCQ